MYEQTYIKIVLLDIICYFIATALITYYYYMSLIDS